MKMNSAVSSARRKTVFNVFAVVIATLPRRP
jgi:hypothetical protein